MARGFLLKNNLTKDTLLTLAKAGLFVIASAASPYFLHKAVKIYFKEKSVELLRKRAQKLRELQKKKLIEFQELPDNSVKITLSHLGKTLVRQYNLENIRLLKPKQWDRKWRIVIYDIPISKKKAANAFRTKVKDLGLYQLQKSVWVSPYECRDEIEFLCAVFDINMNESVFHLKTNEIPKEQKIKKFFQLS